MTGLTSPNSKYVAGSRSSYEILSQMHTEAVIRSIEIAIE